MDFEVRLLGRFSVRHRAEEIPAASYEGRQVRVLLRVLACRQGVFVPRETLVDALWPDRAPAEPERNLNVMIARARRALGDTSILRTDPGGYCFDPHGRCWIDSREFVRLVEEARSLGRSHRSADALKAYLQSLELWVGEPLAEDAHEDWAQEHRSVLFRLYQEALEGGAQAAMLEGDFAQAASLADRALSQEPFREAALVLFAEALHGCGDHAGALQAISTFKARLAGALGLDPTVQTQELELRILQGVHPGPSSPQRSRPGQNNFAQLKFVGRQDELDGVLGALERIDGSVVVVSGSAGHGKSRLLAEARRRRGGRSVEVAAFLADRDEPWTLTRSLVREVLAQRPDAVAVLNARTLEALAGVVPELTDLLRPGSDASTDPQSRRALAMEGAVAVVQYATREDLALFLDDLQWADPTSLTLIAQLQRRLPELKLVLSYRPEDLVPDGPAYRLLEGECTLRIDLGPLSREAIGQLVSDDDLIQVIAGGTDCSPFAVAELVRGLADEGSIVLDENRRWASHTASLATIAAVRARSGQTRAYAGRIRRLPAPARPIMHSLALLGRPSSARLLASANSVSELEVLDSLEALTRAGLVRLADTGWAAAHDLIAEWVSDTIEAEEKARLHALLAHALQRDGADVWEQAHHQAAAGDSRAAAATFAHAGRQSLDTFATEEAERSANAGLKLSPGPQIRSELLEIRAEALVRRGLLKQGRDDLRAALPAKRTGPDRSRIISKLAILISGSEDYLRASELAALAVTEAGEDPATRARALAVGAMVHGNLNHLDEAERLGMQALDLYRSIEDAHGVADILELKALHTLNSGRLREAVAVLGGVVQLFQDSGKLLRVGQPRTLRSFALFMMGNAAEALREMDEVLELELALGHAEGIPLARAGRAMALFGLGRIDEAVPAAQEAVSAAQELGHKELSSIALFVLGIARTGQNDESGTEQALSECLVQSQGLPIFHSMAAAHLAILKVRQGKLAEAAACLNQAAAVAPPFSQFEVRLAQAELAAALNDPAAVKIAADALNIASAEGHLLSVPRLTELAGGRA